MKRLSPALRIDLGYGAFQLPHMVVNSSVMAFSTLFLTYHGLSNTQTGLVTSLTTVGTIAMQLLVAGFLDKRPGTPAGRAIALIYICCMAAFGLLSLLPLPLTIFVMTYMAVWASCLTNMALSNAMMMRYLNAGIPVNYGLPRGVGSLVYAGSSYILGRVVAATSPDTLPLVFIGAAAVSVAAVLAMPKVPPQAAREARPRVSVLTILRKNRTLLLFVVASTVLNMSKMSNGLFLIRVMESLGGGSAELGIGTLIAAGMELPMMFFSMPLLRRFKPGLLLLFSFCSTSVMLFGISVAPSLGLLYGVLALNVFSFGIYCFASVYFVNSLVEPEEAVRSQAILSLSSIGTVVGSTVSGVVIDAFGLQTLLTQCWVTALCAAGLMALCALSAGRRVSARVTV